MKIIVKSGNVLEEKANLAILAVLEGAQLPKQVANLMETGDFSGRIGETLLLYPRGNLMPTRLLLIGIGKSANLTMETIRRTAATAIQQARERRMASFTVGVAGEIPLQPAQTGQALAEGFEMGGYQYSRYRSESNAEEFFDTQQVIVFSEKAEAETRKGVAKGQIIGNGVTCARDLVNHPGYAITPVKMGEVAKEMGRTLGLKVTVLNKTQLIKQGFGGILAVGKGSSNEPCFIVMEHGSNLKDVPTVCLVGKGLTFDSGGLSLKPADAMETMKSDMGGAATVMGAMKVAAELKLPMRLVGLIAAAENMPSGDSYRPGDIVRTLSGKTIEVINTDAEGRIILSDALYYAQRFSPDAIVEFSTLTGAIIIALGMHASGLMATDQGLAEKLIAAGEETSERLWQLPLWEEYHEMVKSRIADVRNLAGRPAGSITAGAFLTNFVGEYPFAHVDIAGTAWLETPMRPYETHGGTGVGVRLLAEYLQKFTK